MANIPENPLGFERRRKLVLARRNTSETSGFTAAFVDVVLH